MKHGPVVDLWGKKSVAFLLISVRKLVSWKGVWLAYKFYHAFPNLHWSIHVRFIICALPVFLLTVSFSFINSQFFFAIEAYKSYYTIIYYFQLSLYSEVSYMSTISLDQSIVTWMDECPMDQLCFHRLQFHNIIIFSLRGFFPLNKFIDRS